jgi:sigma-B regulation protein RsbU (phosphoserine phosphatase)
MRALSKISSLISHARGSLVLNISLPQVIPQLFVGVAEPILEDILADCIVLCADAGDTILSRGQENRTLYILLTGRLKIHLDEQEGAFIEILPGECVGEMSLIDSLPASAHVLADEPSQLLAIPEETFWKLVSLNPMVAKNLLKILSRRIRFGDQIAVQQRLEHLAIEKELTIARAIQASMLTKKFDLISRLGIDLFAIMEPVMEIGGDFYDAFFAAPNKLFICVGDVVGKGLPAALFMVQSLTRLRMEAMRDPTPHHILERVNQGLYENNELEMFVTLFCAVLNTQTGEMNYANGGHNPPLSNAENNLFEFIPMPEGMILGVFETARYESASLWLKPGQSLLAYTDGVPEATNSAGEFFGEERLRNVLNEHISSDANALIQSVRNSLYTFAGNTHPPDDVTLLALRYCPAQD